MVTFKIPGSLPAPWEDFLSLNTGLPSLTIMTRANADEDGFDADAKIDDGWLDLVVDVDYIDLDVARLVIADALGIENPEEIEIIESRSCRSV
ncbi:MAG: hypothetical protein K2X27_05920 [Candidatus Obscuribacterales bacterium]|nr:hypothetical protein [Candidatus Obscuribacterales bacterium]